MQIRGLFTRKQRTQLSVCKHITRERERERKFGPSLWRASAVDARWLYAFFNAQLGYWTTFALSWQLRLIFFIDKGKLFHGMMTCEWLWLEFPRVVSKNVPPCPDWIRVHKAERVFSELLFPAKIFKSNQRVRGRTEIKLRATAQVRQKKRDTRKSLPKSHDAVDFQQFFAPREENFTPFVFFSFLG